MPYRSAPLTPPVAPARPTAWWPRHLTLTLVVSACTAAGHGSVAAGLAEFVVLLPVVALVARGDQLAARRAQTLTDPQA